MLQNWVMESWSCLVCANASAGACSTRMSCHISSFLFGGCLGFGAPKLEAAKTIPSCAPAPLARLGIPGTCYSTEKAQIPQSAGESGGKSAGTAGGTAGSSAVSLGYF